MSKDDCGPQNAAGGGGGGSGSQKEVVEEVVEEGMELEEGIGGEWAANEEERLARPRFGFCSIWIFGSRSRRTGRQRSLGFCTMDIANIARRSLSLGHPRAARRRPLTGSK